MGWKSTTFVTASLIGYVGYRLYQKREAIASFINEANERLPRIQEDLNQIAQGLESLQAFTPVLEKAGQDLERHVTHYQNEKEQRLAVIDSIWQKYNNSK